MPKLATPVQYEPSLEGLNDIRPLQLADEVKVVIPYPVLCSNPPSTGRPAMGKFVRCNQQGALLKHKPYEPLSYYFKDDTITSAIAGCSFIFPTKVYGISAYWKIDDGSPTCFWTNPRATKNIKELIDRAYIWLPFVGNTIWFVGVGEGDWEGYIEVYGFYKIGD